MRKLTIMIAVLFSLIGATAAQASIVRSLPASPSKGTIITIHGGAWYYVGPTAAAMMDSRDQWLHDAGYSVVNITYAMGWYGYADVRRIVARYNPRTTCLYGASAGGHWALMVARKLRVRCVIALSPVTDLAGLADEGSPLAAGTASLFPGKLAAYSPLRLQGWSAKTKYLFTGVTCDPFRLVPQEVRMVSMLRSHGVSASWQTYNCDEDPAHGMQSMIHGYVSTTTANIEQARELRFLRRSFGR